MSTSRRINVKGTVTAITYPGEGPSPRLDVIVTVGQEDRLLLRFLGRRKLGCIEVGSQVRVRGALSDADGAVAVINPDITVLPAEVIHEH